MKEKYSEFLKAFNENDMEKAGELISSFDDDGLILVATIMYNLANENNDEVREVIENYESVFDYFPRYKSIEELKDSIHYLPLVELYKIFTNYNVSHVIEISEYFYELDNDVRSLYCKYGYLLDNINSFDDETFALVNEVLNTYDINEIPRVFVKNAVYNAIWSLVRKDDPRGYELALSQEKGYYNDNNFQTNLLLLAVNDKRDDFIVEFVEKLDDSFYDDADDDKVDIFDYYLNLIIDKDDDKTVNALMFLSNYDRKLIKYAHLYAKYLDRLELSSNNLETVHVITGKITDASTIENDTNLFYFLHLHNKLDELYELFIENDWNIYYILRVAEQMRELDIKFMINWFEYIIKVDLEKDENYGVVGLVEFAKVSEDVFYEQFVKLDLEVNTKYFDYKIYNLIDEKMHYTAKLYCKAIEKFATKGTDIYNIGVTYKLALLIVDNNAEEFIKLYTEHETEISPIISNINSTDFPPREILEFLLMREDKSDLYYVYKRAYKGYLVKNNREEVDLEFVKRILEALEESYDEEKYQSRACIDTALGIYEYFNGNVKKSLELFEKSAYNSPDYCHCGGAYLLYLERKLNGVSVEPKHQEIVLKAMDGFILKADGTYEEREIGLGYFFDMYYAYFALKGCEGFDLEKAQSYLLNSSDNTNLIVVYYTCLIDYKLGNSTLNSNLSLLRELYNYMVYDYQYDYSVILNNIHADIIEPRLF